jgi:hypothetical protein
VQLSSLPKDFFSGKPYSRAKYLGFPSENQIHEKTFRDFLRKIRFAKKPFEIPFGKADSLKKH